MVLLVAGNLVFLHVPSHPPEPVSTWPLEQESQGLLDAACRESKNKGSLKVLKTQDQTSDTISSAAFC